MISFISLIRSCHLRNKSKVYSHWCPVRNMFVRDNKTTWPGEALTVNSTMNLISEPSIWLLQHQACLHPLHSSANEGTLFSDRPFVQ